MPANMAMRMASRRSRRTRVVLALSALATAEPIEHRSEMPMSHVAMRRVLTVIAAAAVLAVAAAAPPAAADGARRVWRGPAYRVGAISRDVITPYYVGYYPGHYSYYPPDPIYVRYGLWAPRHQCWRGGYCCWAC